MAKQILVVDDDEDILDLLKINFEREGYKVFTVADGLKAIDLALAENPDLIILDIMLPELDGWDVLKRIRENSRTQHIPVIFLTAKDSEIDEVVGLELGADDYIVKPFSLAKLKARVRKTFRQSLHPGSNKNEAVLRFGELLIDPPCFHVKVANHSVHFTKKEFEIFLYLAKRPGKVVSRQNLLSRLWGHQDAVYERTVDVYIRNIREKLGKSHSSIIQTIIGVGYLFKPTE